MKKTDFEQNAKEALSDRLVWMLGEIMHSVWDLYLAIRPSKEVLSESQMEELERAAKHLEKTLEAALEALRGRKKDPRWKLKNR